LFRGENGKEENGQTGQPQVRQRGSHRVYRHSTKPGVVIVAGKPGKDVPPGTLGAILKQARLKP
jgi:predicted RNA binding protein YcfA (HicA-like mRNA interferase family)